MVHNNITSHIDNTTSKHTEAHYKKKNSPYPTEENGDLLRHREHNTMLPHPTKKQPIEAPKGLTNAISDRPIQDQKTIGKTKHNSEHPIPSYLLHHD
jgi:hypothetical protein